MSEIDKKALWERGGEREMVRERGRRERVRDDEREGEREMVKDIES